MTNQLLEAALEYAALGWPVFPCRHDKAPHTRSGVLDATTDEETIRAWWEKWPGANVAVHAGAARLVVLDLDPGADEDAVARAVPDLPETRLVASTPRGGRHLYYRLDPDDAPVASRVQPFAAHVDTRSFHGYVLVPPSRTKDGAYEWVSRGRAARRTQALIDACGRPTERHRERDRWQIEQDLPENVDLARAWLRGERAIGSSWCRPAVEGAGGDNTAYATAAMMKSCGLSPGTALEAMWEEWNERCDPPWDWEELETKVENGYSYNTSPPGNVTPAYHVAVRSGMFEPVEATALGDGIELTKGRYRLVDRAGLETIEPPAWLVPDAIPEDAYAMIAGPSGSYKSFLALDLALTVATGGGALVAGEWRGAWDAPRRPGAVLYVAGEGRPGIRNRVLAWERTHFPDGAESANFTMADPLPHVLEQDWEALVELALERHPEGYKLVVLDTVGRAMQGVNENTQEAATAFTRLADELRRGLGCTVLAVHHTGHEHQDRARGSSAFGADLDTLLMTATQGPPRLASLAMAKQKDWEAWERPRWVSMERVDLGEGRSSLVATRAREPERPARAEAEGKLTLALLDEHVLAALKRYRGRELTDNALAKIVAAEGVETPGGDVVEAGASESSLRQKWLPALRQAGSGARVQRMFDPGKNRWRYSPPVDFDPIA